MFRHYLKLLCSGLLLAILALNLIPFSTSDEWLYTLKWINLVCGAGIGLMLLILIWSPWRVICIAFAGGLVLAAWLAPAAQNLDWPWQYLLSGCWGLAFLFGSFALFSLGNAASGLRTWLCCGAASLALAIAALEFYYLFTPQASDGISDLSSRSRYVSAQGRPANESWTDFQCGKILAPGPGNNRIFHRVVKFGQDLFDVVYNFNEPGFRNMPAVSNPENNLMLFGCSMTFGHGLNDEETWAFKLAHLLGATWQVENYAMSSWSANQMLCMLEQGLIPVPTGQKRYALFLAIADHLRRNDFFGAAPHYELVSGVPERTGKHRFARIHNMVDTFNGSQLARETSAWLLEVIMKEPGPMLDLYLALLKRSSELLAEKYGARLYILLWPDFEFARAKMEALGLAIIPAREFLPAWPEGEGAAYRIHPLYESHPNARAATELADGLARYFKNLAGESGTGPGKNPG